MKFIIFSDSHGYTNSMSDVLYDIDYKDCDLVIHLGDYVKDAEKLEIEHPNFNICFISGNNDFKFIENNEKILEVEGKRILACHGHKYNVKIGLERLLITAKQRHFDIVLFGHTHIPYNNEIDGILFLNPGSITQNGAYCVLTINKGISVAEIKKV